MPAIDVAPIYSDPWTQAHYEGMARLIEAVVDTLDKTINGITCRHYCVRFFYTSVNRRRWVEVSAITTWQDHVDRFCPISSGDVYSKTIWKHTVLREEATHPGGTYTSAWVSPPALAVDEVILGIGFSYCIQETCHADSRASAHFYVHQLANPANSQFNLKDLILQDQSATFEDAYGALSSPHTIKQGNSFALLITAWAYEEDTNNGYVYMKAPFIRLERTI